MSEVQENTISGSSDYEQTLGTEPMKPEQSPSEVLDTFVPSSTTSTREDGVEDLDFEDESNSAEIIDEIIDFDNKPSSNGATEIVEERESATSLSSTSTTSSTTSSEQEKKETNFKSPLANWMVKQNVHPKVINLLYWNDWQKTAGVFGGVLFLLFSLQSYQFVAVVTTFALSLLLVALLYRVGMTIVNAVQKTSAEHPFKNLLEENIEISEESVQAISQNSRVFVNCKIKKFQKLFLMEDVFQSLKFAVTLWLISYIGCWFSFLTMVIMCVIGLFTIPKLYEEKQAEIDQAFNLFKSKMADVSSQIEQKLPEKLKKYLGKDKKE